MVSNTGNYNPLYTNDILYIQPPGNTLAQKTANSGIGTNGGFLPLQGIGAGQFMANVNKNNVLKKSLLPKNPEAEGINTFGGVSNSYTLSGNNTRVTNMGEQGKKPCENIYPFLVKNKQDFCVPETDLYNSPNALAFKESSRWRHILDGFRMKKI